jgi:hypothetical protein
MGNEAKGCSNYNWLMVLTILKNMKVNGKDYIPYIMENKTCSKPPTSISISLFINPINTIVISTINHSEIGVMNAPT